MSGTLNRRTMYVDLDKSGFGELKIAQMTPTIQYMNPYDVYSTDEVEIFTNNGDVTADKSTVTISCQNGVGDYSTLMSKRNCKYRPGQGNLARFTCQFDQTNAVSSSVQLAGLGTAFNGFFFGYNGTSFGIMHRYNGAPEIYKVVVSSAFTGAGTVAITLNGVVYNVTSSNASSSLSFSAHQIESGNSYGSIWDVEHIYDSVYFIYKGAGNLTGSFSINFNTGTTGGNGTLTKISDGASPTETWISQSSWNIDNMDGNGKSRMTLNTAKLNVYQIQYQYLGAGAINFFIEDDDTGSFQLVHQIQYANNYTRASLSNPNLRMLYAVASLGSTTALTMKMVSFGAFTEGIINRGLGSKYAISNSKTGITTEKNIIVLENPYLFNEIINHSHIYINYISLAVDGTKNSTIKIYKYGDLGNDTSSNYTNFQLVNPSESCALYDTTTTTISNGHLLYSFVLGKTEGRTIDLSNQELELLRGEYITITCTSASSTECFVSINFVEDF